MENAITGVGLAFDKIDDDEGKWQALVMLLTGFFVESIKPCQYEEAMKDLCNDALENINEYVKQNPLSIIPPEGNA